MLGSLSAAVSGLDVFQQDMNVIGNNIANINTSGFKAARVDLANSFSNTLLAATAPTSLTSGTNAMQVGTGVAIDSISNNWSQGTLSSTNNSSDLAINGNGFFMVKDPVSGSSYVTQVGAFTLDSKGYLVSSQGYRVQGYADSSLTTLGDIKVDMTTTGATSYAVSSQGVISINVAGNSEVVGQVLLQDFQDPSALVSMGSNLYANTPNAGPLAAPTAPGSSGMGTIQSGALELSNVDLSNEMANLITAQRGFEANSKIVTASDEMMQTVVNMVR